MRVEVVHASPRRHASATVDLPAGADVSAALAASGLPLDDIVGYAVHGERVTADAPLRDGDRVELLRALRVDPKEARGQRARK